MFLTNRDAQGFQAERSLTRRIIFVLAFTMALGPRFAAAQPIFHTEHDWTITVAGATFGLRQQVQSPGEFRSTQVFLGRFDFQTRWLAPQIAIAAVVLLAAATMVIVWSERAYRQRVSPKLSAHR